MDLSDGEQCCRGRCWGGRLVVCDTDKVAVVGECERVDVVVSAIVGWVLWEWVCVQDVEK